jgi:anti-sigma-K factor RskA
MSAHEQFADDLALFALGSLSGDERVALESHLAECASCRRELESLRGDLSLLAMTTAGPKPPARAKERLMSAIAAEPRLPRAFAPRARSTEWWGMLGWAAAAVMVLLSVGLLRQNSSLRRDVASLRARFADQQSELQQANQIMATLLDPDAQKIEMVAVGSKPQPRGKAIYQRRNHGLIFLASSLPPLPREKSGPALPERAPLWSRGLLAATSHQPLGVNPADDAEPANQIVGHQAPGLILLVSSL